MKNKMKRTEALVMALKEGLVNLNDVEMGE